MLIARHAIVQKILKITLLKENAKLELVHGIGVII